MRRYSVFPLLAVCLLLVAGCYPQTDSGPGETFARPVDVVKIQGELVAETVSLIGSIEPGQQTLLYFEVGGVVEAVFVDEGTVVRQGDPIARLQLDDFKLAVSQALAESEVVRSRSKLLEIGTRKEDIATAEAEFARAKVRAAYWAGELQRTRTLFGQNAVSDSRLEQVAQAHDAAEQARRAAEAQRDRAVNGPREEDKRAARAAVDARQQAVAMARRQQQKATLVAPFGGRVERRLVDVGAYINVFPTGGAPVVNLVDLSEIEAVIAVPEAHRGHFAARPSVEIVSAIDATVRARLDNFTLGNVADTASGTYELRARLPNPDGRFTAGMVVVATSAGKASRRAVRIPLTAVRRPYGQPPYVLLVDPKSKRAVSQPVELGPIAGDRIEITKGLSDGNLLIVRGQHRVVAGDEVEHRSAAPPSADEHGVDKNRGPVP